MRSKAPGLMATLLMFVPLLAVPFLAGFGVPWLAAKSRSENLPVPDLSPPILEPEVGHSHSGRHSAEDLFAPVMARPAVDLRMTKDATPAQTQNPRLRNASLVVSHDDPWFDPFDVPITPQQNPDKNPERTPQPRQAVNPDRAAPQQPLEGWTLKDPPAENSRPVALDPNEKQIPSGELIAEAKNPFAELDASAPSPAGIAQAPVSVAENAFENPGTAASLQKDAKNLDAPRTLFGGPVEKSAPKQTAALPSPAASAPPAVSAPPAEGIRTASPAVRQPPPPLTWQTAQARLKALGIERYYLEPDPAGQVFLFRCAYSPPGNPRISRRFEAEAAEPLEAVRKVLKQVETWTARN